MRGSRLLILVFAIPVLLLSATVLSAREYLLVQSGTTLRDSGFFDAVLPGFTRETGIELRVVAVGTGQAIRNAQRGDGDLLFTHSTVDELHFVAEGYGIARRDVMFNHFVLVGPAADPAGVGGSGDVVASLGRIAEFESPFVSRGDDSGTHKAELRYWAAAEIDIGAEPPGWYRSLGSGMGATLNTGIAMGAYLLTDEATWRAFRNKRGHRVLVRGDPRLRNQYGVVLVRPPDGAPSKLAAAESFFDWIVSEAGQVAIACFRIGEEQAYVPNADGVMRECGQ